jgi:hypothetical protein
MLKQRFSIVCFLAVTLFSWRGNGEEPLFYQLGGFYAQLEDWIRLDHDPAFPWDPRDLRGHFSYQRGQAQDLYGSADLAYLLDTIGELETRGTPRLVTPVPWRQVLDQAPWL